MSMTYIQLIQQCTLAIWGGGVTLNFYPTYFASTSSFNSVYVSFTTWVESKQH